MMAGLNSETFNFLSSHDETLMIKSKLKSISVARAKPVDFYSLCVSLSRPCLLPAHAKTWPAYNQWAYINDGYTVLSKQMNEKKMTVFDDEDPEMIDFTMDDTEYFGNSFKEQNKKNMPF